MLVVAVTLQTPVVVAMTLKVVMAVKVAAETVATARKLPHPKQLRFTQNNDRRVCEPACFAAH